MHLSVSIIVPTFNGSKRIHYILSSLLEQTYQDFELIIVDDGSTDNTLNVIDSFIHSFSTARVISQANQGRASVRNKGAKNAKGDLLLFFDDDIKIQSDTVEKHLLHHKNYPNSVLVGPAFEDETLNISDFYLYKASLTKKWMKSLANEKKVLEIPALTGQNFSIPRSLFLKFNGFLDCLTDAEDFELATRIHKDNYPIYVDPQLYVWHYDFTVCHRYIKRLREYHAAQLHLKALNLPYQVSNADYTPSPFKRSIYRFFSYPLWVHLIEKERLLFLPQKIRFKIYTLVTISLGVIFRDKKVPFI